MTRIHRITFLLLLLAPAPARADPPSFGVNALASGAVKGDGVTDDGPALQAVIDQNPGRLILLPTTRGAVAPSYYSSRTLRIAGPATRLAGEGGAHGMGTILQFGPGVSGVEIAPTATGAALENLVLRGKSSWQQVYCSQGVIPSGSFKGATAPLRPGDSPPGATDDGVRVGANLCRLTSVVALGFGRHGFNLGNQDLSGPGVDARCDNSVLIACDGLNNRGYGFFVQGGDSNAGTFLGCRASVNQGGGFNDQSFLGGTYVAPKCDENHFDQPTKAGNIPASQPLASIARASGVVTLTFAKPYAWRDPAGGAFLAGHGITVSAPGAPSFSGTFIVGTPGNSTVTYAQAGPDATAAIAGATARLATMREAWTAAGIPAAGAIVTSRNGTSRVVLLNPYVEGGQTPDGTGLGALQLGDQTTLIGGILGSAPDRAYGTPAVFPPLPGAAPGP